MASFDNKEKDISLNLTKKLTRSHSMQEQSQKMPVVLKKSKKREQKQQDFIPYLDKQKLQKLNKNGRKSKHFWSNYLSQKMLNEVASNKTWKQIQNLKMFSAHKISNNQIKRKFQTQSNFKFRYLYRQSFKSTQYPNISDVVYQNLMRKDQIKWFYQKKIINKRQMQCLLDYSVVFLTNSNVDDTRIKRDRESKNKIMEILPSESQYTPKFYIECILKLNNYNLQIKKQNRQKKLQVQRAKSEQNQDKDKQEQIKDPNMEKFFDLSYSPASTNADSTYTDLQNLQNQQLPNRQITLKNLIFEFNCQTGQKSFFDQLLNDQPPSNTKPTLWL